MNRLTQKLNASVKPVAEGKTLVLRGTATIRASDPGSGSEGSGGSGRSGFRQRRIEILAYTGGELRVPGFPLPVVVDLAGLDIRAEAGRRPVLINHKDDPEHTLGQITAARVVPPDRLIAEGVVTGTSPTAQRVLANNDAGHQYQASIGADVLEAEVIEKNMTVRANGRTFTGPIILARRSSLGEISFCNLGADDSTSARIAARKRAARGKTMDFNLWLKARGLTVDGLAEDKVKELRAQFSQFLTANGLKETEEPAGAAEDADTDPARIAASAVQQIRQAATDETERVNYITKLCARAEFADVASEVDQASGLTLQAMAIRDNWTKDRINAKVHELALAKMKTVNGRIGSSGATVDANVLQAAALRAGGYDSRALEAAFKPQTLEVVDKRFRRGIGMKQLLLEAAWANGFQDRWMDAGNLDGVLRAAFSTTAISGILSNVANKFLVRGFMSVNQAWRRISMLRPATDFKTMTSYRLTADAVFEKVGPAGQIKHGTLGEESWTNQLGTYGRMITITRQDQINDDLGAITQVPQRLGLGAGRSFNQIFWTTFMDNAAFFAAANGNYISGATTTLTSVGLGLGVKAFRDMVDTDGHPVDIDPSILAVPSALEVSARELYQSGNVNTGGAASTEKVPNKNIYTGLYEPLTIPYLGNSSYSGNSATAWYLLCDPNVAGIGVMEVAFLNGQENPTIETADADFSTLGIQMRGFSDFGTAKAEKKAGIKSKGAA